MADPRGIDELERCDLTTLRAASFCAEPVSPAVHAFAMEHICKHYVNSYWASEHGGIVFTRPYCADAAPPPADAKCSPVPWLRAKVMVASYTDQGQVCMRDAVGAETLFLPCQFLFKTPIICQDRLGTRMRKKSVFSSSGDERGEIVLEMGEHALPTLARTLWGDKGQFDSGSKHWRGNFKAWESTYFRKVGVVASYFSDGDLSKRTTAAGGAAAAAAAAEQQQLVFVQGDFAQQHADGAFSFHGAKNATLLRHFILKMIILPRQAQDKHRENPKRDAFSAFFAGRSDDVMNVGGVRIGVGKQPFFSFF
jgi:acrylyl-CoA reductase (NADPH)/3-hydroxypropionyl-CoA dehydratase/3-hydroxypropionyl-CoA synthetase